MSTFDELSLAVSEINLRYEVVSFPIKHVGGGEFQHSTTSLGGTFFKFTVDGAGYLSERNTEFKYAQFTALVREERWDELELLANKAILPIKGAGKGLIFALVDDAVVGILRHYNVVKHEDLIQAVADAHLQHDVIAFALTQQFMSFDILSSVVGDEYESFSVALRILNGHSGHVALRYQLLVKSKGFEYTKPLYGRSRHLSKVQDTVKVLSEALDQVADEKLDVRLRNMSDLALVSLIRTLVPTTTARQEGLLQLLDHSECETGLDVVILLGQYASTRGYASAVDRMLTPVIDHLLTLKS